MNKICTSIEQSQKLVELGIDVNTADMIYNVFDVSYVRHGTPIDKYHTPAWSLAALLHYLKSKNKFPEIKELSDGRFKLTTFIWDGKNSIQFSIADNLIDACYEMILKLHEQKLL